MAEKKFEELTHLNEGYKLAAKVDDNGRRTRTVVVLNAQNEVVQQVSKGKLVPNGREINSMGLDYTATPFEDGVATVSYITPYWGQGMQNGGDDATIGLTRSGYTVYASEIADIRNAFKNPEILKKIKIAESDYSRKYKIYLDVAQHSFERKGKEFANDPKALKELTKLAKNVVAHLAREFEKNNKKSSEGLAERLAALTGQAADVTLVSGGE